jgi:hypothetical protein
MRDLPPTGRRPEIAEGLSLSELASIAASLDDQSGTTFTTVPWMPYPADPFRLEFRQPAANRLFQRLKSELV